MSNRIENHPVLGDLPPAKSITIYVDGEPVEAREGEPVAAALLAIGYRQIFGWITHIDQTCTRGPGSRCNFGEIRQFKVQTANDIQTSAGGFLNGGPPAVRHHATDRCNADNQAFDTRLHGFGNGHVRHAHIHFATGKTQLPRNQLRPPLDDTQTGFGIGRIGQVTDQDQVRRIKLHRG